MSTNSLENLLVPRVEEDCVLVNGLRVKELQETGENSVVEVSPCTSERGKILMEIDFSKNSESSSFLNSEILCLLLESYRGHFAELKCSTKLGLARLMWKAHRIYVYERGKFKIRYAHSREDAIQFADSMGRVVLPSIICEKCGHPAIECLSGVCNDCVVRGSPEIIDIKDHFNGPLLTRSYDSLLKFFKRASEFENKAEFDAGIGSTNKDVGIKRKLHEAIGYAMDFSLENEDLSMLRAGIEIIFLATQNLLLLEQEREISGLLKSKFSEISRKSIIRLDALTWKMNEELAKSIDADEQVASEEVDSIITKAYDAIGTIEDSLGTAGKTTDRDKIVKGFRDIIDRNRCFTELIYN